MAGGNCILHVISVGFHHRRGASVSNGEIELILCQVEAVFPPVKSFPGSGEQEFIELPAKWKHLASLALPDGAHNYLKGIFYFNP